MPMSFITDHLKSTDGYKNWMQPLTQTSSGGTNDSRARLVTSLGENSDLIELSLETSSMMFFRQTHNLRMIRSIFPCQEESQVEPLSDDELVIGFKLAKQTDDCQGIQIYLLKIKDKGEMDDKNGADGEEEQVFQLYMLLESAMPRYSKVLSKRKSLAQKLGAQLITCFCNLETFLNLEFETGKEASGSTVNFDEEESHQNDSQMSQPFNTAADIDNDYDHEVKVMQTGAVSTDSIREQRASPRSLGSLQVSAIKPDQSADQTSS